MSLVGLSILLIADLQCCYLLMSGEKYDAHSEPNPIVRQELQSKKSKGFFVVAMHHSSGHKQLGECHGAQVESSSIQ